ncbi:hypothetical protein PHSY_004720 [Pseudozyma hubeiensis SY62]|uniref:Uncharacterized protein n=1 Tax=Pseudozyma hubeiensis (strain SY62) TaxID=1305764 RepID=R9PG94_PSEHS|nr:hypothetical protein PHSY_004720 [Pseudozyma hubeiensis SY62]GAC97135.1 hypothetical protein PHSY_004720 [Pseudozyma hubeiensis SY62]
MRSLSVICMICEGASNYPNCCCTHDQSPDLSENKLLYTETIAWATNKTAADHNTAAEKVERSICRRSELDVLTKPDEACPISHCLLHDSCYSLPEITDAPRYPHARLCRAVKDRHQLLRNHTLSSELRPQRVRMLLLHTSEMRLHAPCTEVCYNCTPPLLFAQSTEARTEQ